MIHTQANLVTKKNPIKDVWFYGKEGELYPNEKYKTGDKGILVSEVDNKRYAKVEIYADNTKRCFLKTLRAGRVGEVIVDPWSSLGTDKEMNSNNDLYATRACEYALVNEDVFYQYVDYLKTRNPARIRFVERSYLNGDANL